MRRAAAALAALLAFAGGAQAEGQPGDFDFYVLALSWSPTWCGSDEGAGDLGQCDIGARFGFVVHGLWPQYEEGYPEFCGEGARQRIPAWIAEEMADLMPDRDLVFGEWRKHGSCTGLSPEDYFALTREAYDGVAIPAEFTSSPRMRAATVTEVEEGFVAANPGLPREGIAVTCAARQLDEVRICMARDLAFRGCPEVDARGCRQDRMHVPAPR